MLVAVSNAFDIQVIDGLVFLNNLKPGDLYVSGDGVLIFARLIAAGLAQFQLVLKKDSGPLLLYDVSLTGKGKSLIGAWRTGDSQDLEAAITKPITAIAT
jgi:hypothetical protein